MVISKQGFSFIPYCSPIAPMSQLRQHRDIFLVEYSVHSAGLLNWKSLCDQWELVPIEIDLP